MPTITVSRDIDATPDTVFRAVSDIEHLPDTSDDILAVEFLTEQRVGAGTRFVETRSMNGSEMKTELEVVSYDADARTVRMVTDSHGTIWDTTMTVEQRNGHATLTLKLDALGSTWLKRVMNIVMWPFFKRGMASHLDKLAGYCEAA